MHQDAVFIGRFQPFHNAHLATVRFALQQAEQLIIVIGGDNKPRTTKDPWTSAERIAMIRNCLTPEEQGRCSFVAVKDFLYNDNLWLAEVQRAVKTFSDGKDVVLVGHKKDNSSSSSSRTSSSRASVQPRSARSIFRWTGSVS